MKVYVDPELCISCGTCVDLCPEVYDWNEDEKAQSTDEEVSEEAEDCAQEALESCPVDAIKQIE